MKKWILMLVAATVAMAAPIVTVNFGSNSGCCGNLNVTVSGLSPSEVLTFQISYGIDVIYLDGRPNPGPFPQDFMQAVQTVSNGTFSLGTFGQTYNTTWHENLRYLHLAIDSNVNGHVGTFLVDPIAPAQYVALGPIRQISPSEVPEPATFAGTGLALAAIGLWKWRRACSRG